MTLTSTMDASIQQFASCFTKPSCQTFGVIVTGWLLVHGRRVTRILLAGDGLKVKTFRGRLLQRQAVPVIARPAEPNTPSGAANRAAGPVPAHLCSPIPDSGQQ